MDKQIKPLLLFVDDSRVMRLAAEKMLGKEFRVEVAEHGVEAWAMIGNNPDYSVVFSDLAMPEMDGYALLGKIRNSPDEGVARMPVIIVTGAENDEEARNRALASGATDFISKPFNSTDLLARARAHANYQQERKALARQAMVDPLTALGNHRYLTHRLGQELALSARQKSALSVVQLEIYQFNQFFIQLGKRRADMVLLKLAQLLQGVVRKEDSLARSKVDQFTVLLPSADIEGARRFVERTLKVCEKLAFHHRGKLQRLPVNVVLHSPDADSKTSPEALQKILDGYMQRARAGGAGTVVGDDDEVAAAEKQVPVMGVEQALGLIQAGKQRVVVNALPDLKRQLMPLLKLMQQASSGREIV
ncbi:diguanylate cyclase domain-containing protein [Alcanivorax sp. DP30]|uniref:GGDEF domain-containing response regulator n=1 Tax=Alcanivorax sp. DP30 TaxID=2606217 RepID=UPI001368BD43|nr:diguanylate cyclase [Alcanivorax sp. DP30]MZR61598.1 response regulator [Alcanivorax sp. DP30]